MKENLTPYDEEWYDVLFIESDEIWKEIVGYEGYYKISNYGRVASLLFQNNVCNKKYARFKILKPKGLKSQSVYKTGFRVDLWKDGVKKSMLIARLVAFTFYNKDINNHNLTVDHIDGNRLNNKLDNLELVTLKENIQRAFKTGLHGKHMKKIKLQYKDCGKPIYCNSMSEASRILGYKNGYISDKIKKGKFENKEAMWKIIN